jgi:hypothetical protein
MKKWIILVAVLMFAVAPVAPVAPAAAQNAQKTKAPPNGGLGLAWLLPQDDLKETHDKGFGIHVMFAYQLADKMELSGTTGWNRLKADALGAEDFNMWEMTLGPRAMIKMFYLGVEGGYFTKIDEWGWVPNAGVRYKIFDLGYRMKTSGETKYHTIRAGVFF